MLTLDTIRQAPKALLHDHLDGGLRPATVVDLASEFGYAGLAACAYNMRVNHRYLRDAATIARQTQTIERLEDDAKALLERVRRRVGETLASPA